MAKVKPGTECLEVSEERVEDVTDIQPGSSKDTALGDDEILRAQGHEAVMKRSFSLFSSLGLAFR